MKVFVPCCEEDVAEASVALGGARLVPYQLNYPVLRARRRPADVDAPELGEVQVIDAAAWDRQQARRQARH